MSRVCDEDADGGAWVGDGHLLGTDHLRASAKHAASLRARSAAQISEVAVEAICEVAVEAICEVDVEAAKETAAEEAAKAAAVEACHAEGKGAKGVRELRDERDERDGKDGRSCGEGSGNGSGNRDGDGDGDDGADESGNGDDGSGDWRSRARRVLLGDDAFVSDGSGLVWLDAERHAALLPLASLAECGHAACACTRSLYPGEIASPSHLARVSLESRSPLARRSLASPTNLLIAPLASLSRLPHISLASPSHLSRASPDVRRRFREEVVRRALAGRADGTLPADGYLSYASLGSGLLLGDLDVICGLQQAGFTLMNAAFIDVDYREHCHGALSEVAEF